jgi:hypothetical protein
VSLRALSSLTKLMLCLAVLHISCAQVSLNSVYGPCNLTVCHIDIIVYALVVFEVVLNAFTSALLCG